MSITSRTITAASLSTVFILSGCHQRNSAPAPVTQATTPTTPAPVEVNYTAFERHEIAYNEAKIAKRVEPNSTILASFALPHYPTQKEGKKTTFPLNVHTLAFETQNPASLDNLTQTIQNFVNAHIKPLREQSQPFFSQAQFQEITKNLREDILSTYPDLRYAQTLENNTRSIGRTYMPSSLEPIVDIMAP